MLEHFPYSNTFDPLPVCYFVQTCHIYAWTAWICLRIYSDASMVGEGRIPFYYFRRANSVEFLRVPTAPGKMTTVFPVLEKYWNFIILLKCTFGRNSGIVGLLWCFQMAGHMGQLGLACSWIPRREIEPQLLVAASVSSEACPHCIYH